MILRETKHYIATTSERGVRITTKDTRAMPQSRTVTERTWEILKAMSDSCFDGSCVLELGIGTYLSRTKL